MYKLKVDTRLHCSWTVFLTRIAISCKANIAYFVVGAASYLIDILGAVIFTIGIDVEIWIYSIFTLAHCQLSRGLPNIH